MRLLLTFLICMSAIFLRAQLNPVIKNMDAGRSYHISVPMEDRLLFIGGNSERQVDYLYLDDCDIQTRNYGSPGFGGGEVIYNDDYAFFHDLTGINLVERNYYSYNRTNGNWHSSRFPDDILQNFYGGYIIK